MLSKLLTRPTINTLLLHSKVFFSSTTIVSYTPQKKRVYSVPQNQFYGGNRTSLSFEVKDQAGALSKVLSIFNAADINLTRIQSHMPLKAKTASGADSRYSIDLQAEADPFDQKLVNCINLLKTKVKVDVKSPPEVPWFPGNLNDVSMMGKKLLKAGDGLLEVDHPGFRDEHYKNRRDYIAKVAIDYDLQDSQIPRVKYEEDEIATWGYCYERLVNMFKSGGATNSFLNTLSQMEKNCGFSVTNIPQLDDISKYLRERTGWRLKPVGGLLTQREFLNGLAFKVFHSTQYIRHKSVPLYTPQPDIVHELMGHAPMFADKDFAQLSQQIGLASLGASDADIAKLGTVYWYTVEFGLCRQEGKRKAYGAGVLSSIGEMEWAMKNDNDVQKPEFKQLDCDEIEKHLDFPITKVQPFYFVADSFLKAKQEVQRYSSGLKRPFHACYCEENGEIIVDKRLKLKYGDKIPNSEKTF